MGKLKREFKKRHREAAKRMRVAAVSPGASSVCNPHEKIEIPDRARKTRVLPKQIRVIRFDYLAAPLIGCGVRKGSEKGLAFWRVLSVGTSGRFG